MYRFRGIPGAHLAMVKSKYLLGSDVHWSAFNSTSTNIAKTKQFAQAPVTIFQRQRCEVAAPVAAATPFAQLKPPHDPGRRHFPDESPQRPPRHSVRARSRPRIAAHHMRALCFSCRIATLFATSCSSHPPPLLQIQLFPDEAEILLSPNARFIVSSEVALEVI